MPKENFIKTEELKAKEKKEGLKIERIVIAIIGIVIITMVAVVIWRTTQKEPLAEIIPKSTEKPIKKTTGIINVGYGWSTKEQTKEAVKEASMMVKKQLGSKIPQYIILFSTVDYDSEELLKETKRLFRSTTQIYGGTSMLGVLTRDGFHTSKNGALALMAISSSQINFGVGGADVNNFSSAKEAGKQAILLAINNAGKTPEELPKLVLITGSVGNEEKLLEGIEDVIGNKIPIIGGSAGDNNLMGNWKQFANNQVYSNGVSVTAVYTDLKINWAYESGYSRGENKGIITKAKGRIIYEINNRPAAEVYNEWTKGSINEELETGGSVLAKTTFHPLAKIIRGESGEIYYLSIHPLSVNLPEKSLTVFTNVKEGEKLIFMHGNWELLLNRAQTTPAKALAGVAKEKIAFGIYTYCAGTMLAIPPNERLKIPLLINSELEGAPFIGTFTFGEQGLLAEAGNRHGNLVNSMIVFTEEMEQVKNF